MPKLVTQATVCVIRDSKRVFPQIGKAFGYTDQEAERIKKVSPTALRKPVNEDAAVEAEPVEDEFASEETTEAPKGKGKGKAKPAAAAEDEDI